MNVVSPAASVKVPPEAPAVEEPVDPAPERRDESPPPVLPSPVNRPVAGAIPKVEHWLVTVIGTDGRPVPKAVVLVVTHLDPRTPQGIVEMVTNGEGTVEVDMKERKYVRFYAYKPGVGAGYSAVIHVRHVSNRANVVFNGNNSIRFHCMETNGAPADQAEVTILTELHVDNRKGEPVMFSLPPRKATADQDGRCEIDALFSQGPWTRIHGQLIPGTRYIAKAAWRDLCTPEKTIETPPLDDVWLVLSLVK